MDDELFTLPTFSELEIWTKRAQVASVLFNSDRSVYSVRRVIDMLIRSCDKVDDDYHYKEEYIGELESKLSTLEDSIQLYMDQLHEQDTQLQLMKYAIDELQCDEVGSLKKKEDVDLTGSSFIEINKKREDNLGASSLRPKLTVACDSHGRDLSSYLEHIINGHKRTYNIFNHTQPGAPFEVIMSSVLSKKDLNTYTSNDYIVVIGGTNNVNAMTYHEDPKMFMKFTASLEKQLAALNHTNLILATIPYRYDLREDSLENEIIQEYNFIIRKLAAHNNHVDLLDLYLLDRYCHTRHGLHINKKGKKGVSNEIFKIIKKKVTCTRKDVSKPCLKAKETNKCEQTVSALPLTASTVPLGSVLDTASGEATSGAAEGENGGCVDSEDQRAFNKPLMSGHSPFPVTPGMGNEAQEHNNSRASVCQEVNISNPFFGFGATDLIPPYSLEVIRALTRTASCQSLSENINQIVLSEPSYLTSVGQNPQVQSAISNGQELGGGDLNTTGLNSTVPKGETLT